MHYNKIWRGLTITTLLYFIPNSYYGVSVSKWCLQASEIECRVILLSQQIGVTNLMHIYVPTLRLSFTPTCRKILLTTTKISKINIS